MAVIAIFGRTYCSAEEIAEKLAHRLGYRATTQKIVELAAQKSGISQEKILRTLDGSRGLLDSFTHEWDRNLVSIKAALAQVLETDEQIIFGPVAQLIPHTISHVLRVEIVASREYRVQKAMELEGIDEKEALRKVEKNNQDSARWAKQLISYVSADPASYDIKLPIHTMPLDDALNLICQSIGKEALKPTEHSIQAVLDFQLAATIGTALVDRKQYSCDVTADQGKVTIVINQKAPPQGKLARTMQSLRFENAEEEVRKICTGIESCQEVFVRPGAGYHQVGKTLLVDDEKDYVMTLSERLEMRDIDSDVVYNGEQALTFMKTENPDVMVLDLRMPGMDGFEVLRHIKRDHPRVEVIIVTGHGGDKERQQAFDYGAFDYLEKPVNINVLAERIREASLKAARAQNEVTSHSESTDEED